MKTRTFIPVISMILLSLTALAPLSAAEQDKGAGVSEQNAGQQSANSGAPANTTGEAAAPEKHKIFSLGIGFHFGIFASEGIDDVNRHMYEKVDSEISTTITRDDTVMYLNLVPRFTINIMPVRYFMIQILGEVAWAPKVIVVINADDTYLFNNMRYSAGLVLNGYIPLGSQNKYSLLIGGGALYNFFGFEGYSASSFGGRGQIGLRIDWPTKAFEVFLGYDYARGESRKYNPYLGRNMVLDYSSVIIGISGYFKII